MLKPTLKQRLTLGLNYGLQAVEEALADDSPLRNQLIHYQSQYNDLSRMGSQGILPYDQLEIGLNKIRQGLLELIDAIGEGDARQQEQLPNPRNTELQHRKQNFFELLRIHYANLEKVQQIMTYYGDGGQNQEVRAGREAFRGIYKDSFSYRFSNPRAGEEMSIQAFSRHFFLIDYPLMEVYFKTVRFILEYILEDEVEQDFFLGVFKSSLSSAELIMICYYAISDLDPGWKKVLVSSGILEENIRQALIDPEHYDLLLSK